MQSSRPIPLDEADNVYRWKKEVGKGSFGVVYLAESTKGAESSSQGARKEPRHKRKRQYLVERREKMPKLVAIKVLRHRPDDLSYCQPEVLIHSACQSPHIVRFFEAFLMPKSATEVQTFIVMEYCRHKTLFDLVEKCIDYNESHGPDQKVAEIPTECIKHAISSITMGTEYLHTELNVVHRDLKSDNCFIDANGNVKIGDFGLSKCRTDLPTGMLATMVGGPPYQAPEVHQRLLHDDKSDVWSLGIITIELADLNYPHASHSGSDLTRLICDGPAPTLSEHRSWDTKKWEMLSFVQLCCEKNHAKRPNSTFMTKHSFITRGHRGDSMLQFIRDLADGTIGSPRSRDFQNERGDNDNAARMGRQSHEESAPFGTNQLGPVRSLLFPKREREIPGLVNVDSPVARRGLLKRSRSSSSSTGQEERQVPRRLLLREDITEINEENFHQRCEQSFVELTEKLHIWKNACCHSLKALWEETHGLEPYPLEYYAWFATANDFDFTTTWEDLKSFSIQYSIANMETPLLRSKATFPIPGLKSVAGHDMFYVRPGGFPTTAVETALDLATYTMSTMKQRNVRGGIGAIINMEGFAASIGTISFFERLVDALFGGRGPTSVNIVLLVHPPGTSFASWQFATSDYKDKVRETSIENLKHELSDERLLPKEEFAVGRRSRDQMVNDFIAERRALEDTPRQLMRPEYK